MNYRCEYKYCRLFGQPRHIWALVGAHGGLHLHITDYGEKHEEEYGYRYQGGIEVHWRHPPSGANRPPDNDECWLLKCPCWHDGSSLQATETWIPIWLSCKDDHDHMFAMLANEADRHLNPEENE